MTQTKKEGGRVELVAGEGCFLRRIGSSENCRETKRLTVPASKVSEWEEVAIADIPPYSEAQYEARVTSLIRERYSVSAEFAVLRQRDSNPEEFAVYNSFAEECKAQAKVMLIEEALTPDSELQREEN